MGKVVPYGEFHVFPSLPDVNVGGNGCVIGIVAIPQGVKGELEVLPEGYGLTPSIACFDEGRAACG